MVDIDAEKPKTMVQVSQSIWLKRSCTKRISVSKSLRRIMLRLARCANLQQIMVPMLPELPTDVAGNLGNPRKEVLLKLLDGKQVSEKVKEAIESLNCPHCQNYGIKKGVSPGSVDRAENFNQVVQADVMWIKLNKKKREAILSMVDECTRYMAARIVSDEKSPSLIKALERSWIRFHGPMQQLTGDENAGWGSLQHGAENHDMELKISPGQVSINF